MFLLRLHPINVKLDYFFNIVARRECVYANYNINISICTLIYHRDEVPPTSVAKLSNWLSDVIFE